jgi:hypothetical protein
VRGGQQGARTVQHSTAQHSTAQHSTAHSGVQMPKQGGRSTASSGLVRTATWVASVPFNADTLTAMVAVSAASLRSITRVTAAEEVAGEAEAGTWQ